jgi:hypothetical protein
VQVSGSGSESVPGPAIRRKGFPVWQLGAVVAVICVLVAPFASGGSSASSILVLKPPFTGSTAFVVNTTSHAGCAATVIGIPAGQSAISGKGAFGSHVAASACRAAVSGTSFVGLFWSNPIYNGSYAEMTTNLVWNTTLSGSLGGSHLKAQVDLRASGSWNTTGGTCHPAKGHPVSYCVRYSIVELKAQLALIDQSTGSLTYGGLFDVAAGYRLVEPCRGSNCSTQVTGSSPSGSFTAAKYAPTLYLNRSLTSGHTYDLYLVITGIAATASGVYLGKSFPGVHGSASLDVHSVLRAISLS